MKSLGEVRCLLALRFLEATRRLGLWTIVIDDSPGDSGEEVRAAFASRGAEVHRQTAKTMGGSRREGWQIAYDAGANVITWSEPEKDNFVPSIPGLMSIVEEGGYDIVVPRRQSLESYPMFQQYCETIGNRIAAIMTGLDVDRWFGPKVFNRKAAPFFLSYNLDGGRPDRWDSIMTPVDLAHASGLSIGSVPVDFTYPEAQRQEEEGVDSMDLKRWDQLRSILDSIKVEAERLGLPRK